jgi:hypothetical protein
MGKERRLRLVFPVGLVAGLLLLAAAPVAQSRSTETLALDISFFANGTINVTLPDGSALGATSGTPQEVPAGLYNLYFSGPGGCSSVPFFHLSGPGINISTDMSESAALATTANLLPSSTYVWTDQAYPSVSHTFTTSAIAEGSPPTSTTGSTSTTSGKGVTYPSIVGSDATPFRGTLTATVDAAAKISLSFKGKRPTKLVAGKYTISVSDRSVRGGLTLDHAGHAAITISTAAFTGKRTKSIDLSAGTWLVASGKTRAQYSLVVS